MREYKRILSNPGSSERPIYKSIVDDDGSISVKVVGFENFQDFIDSFEPSCNVNNIVARAVNGEPELLHQVDGMYGDFTAMPKTYAEMLQKMIDARDFFDHMSADRKAIFGNDVNQFISSIADDDFLVKAGLVTPVDKESESSES